MTRLACHFTLVAGRRFGETARELGCDEGQALGAAFGKIVPPKLPSAEKKPG